MVFDKLLLITNNDIPFQPAKLIIHNPIIKQIAFIGESNFWIGCQYLTFSKDKMNDQDKNHLKDISNFNILMKIINQKTAEAMQTRNRITMLLSLLFPGYITKIIPTGFFLFKQGEKTTHLIGENEFEDFGKCIQNIFCLNTFMSKSQLKYNVEGPQGRALVKKFEQRQRRLQRQRGEGDSSQINILSQYVSILAVGQHKDMNSLLQYTVYQLFDEFQRFQLKENFQFYMEAKMAGAKDLKDVQNWMMDIHSNKK